MWQGGTHTHIGIGVQNIRKKSKCVRYCLLFKTKIELSFKDLIPFVQLFMNWVAFNLADKKELQRVQNKRCL